MRRCAAFLHTRRRCGLFLHTMAHKHATLHTMAHEHAIIMSFRFSESCYSKYKNETARQWPGACYAQEYNSSANLGHDGKKLLPRMQMRSNQTLLL